MQWRRGSRCEAGQCVEVAFRKSSRSNASSSCVEVGADPCGVVLVRDSKDRGGPVLAFTDGAWQAFVAGVRDGEFDAADG